MPESDTRRRILQAATRLFLDQGYGKTRLEQIAGDAGVTKPTVYSHFGSKQGILEAMTQMHTREGACDLRANLQSSGHPEEELGRFAQAFLTRVMSEEARSWQRLGTAESDQYPEVGEAFFNAGPRRVFEFLTDYLKQEKRVGRLSCSSPERAAEQFLGMLLGLDLLRSLVGQPLPEPRSLKRRADETVQSFLALYWVQPSASPDDNFNESAS